MLGKSMSRWALCLGLVVPLSLSTIACGGSNKPATNVANVQAGALPEGGKWEGVYYNQLYGFLHITETNGAVQAAWRTTAGDKWGELYGEIEGDLLRFSWKEHKIGVVGPQATSQGKGYFKYTIPKAGEAHELKGEWGLGESNAGHSWDCVKQVNQEPDPKSVRPDELESRVSDDSFDGPAKKESDDSEAPADGE